MQRRRFLRLTSLAAAGGLAGCTGNVSSVSGGDTETGDGTVSDDSMEGEMGGETSGMDESNTADDERQPNVGQTAYESVEIAIEVRSATEAIVNFEVPEPVQCSIAYGTGKEYGTLRADEMMTGPMERHRIPIEIDPGTVYRARLNLFDNALNAIQTPEFTFTTPETGTATRSTSRSLAYVETDNADALFTSQPAVDIGERQATVAYDTTVPTLAATQFRQDDISTTRRDLESTPHTSHGVSIQGLQANTKTQWRIGLVTSDASISRTVVMSFDTE